MKTKKLSKSGGAIATIADVMKKLELSSSHEKRDRESNNSSTSLDDERKSPVVTKIRFSGIHMYATAIQREEKVCYLWLNAMFFTETDCVDLAQQISHFLSFLYYPAFSSNSSNIKGDFQPDYLDAIVTQISNEKSPNENADFKAPGAVGWRFALRDYSHTVPGSFTLSWLNRMI